jgi:hypothetical protein
MIFPLGKVHYLLCKNMLALDARRFFRIHAEKRESAPKAGACLCTGKNGNATTLEKKRKKEGGGVNHAKRKNGVKRRASPGSRSPATAKDTGTPDERILTPPRKKTPTHPNT